MPYNSNVSLDKLPCTDYHDFGKDLDNYRQFFWSKKDSTYLDVKLNVFEEGDNKDFLLVQNLTVGVADFNQFMPLRNQLVIAAENFAREENLSLRLIPTLFKDMDEQLKLARKVVDVVD